MCRFFWIVLVPLSVVLVGLALLVLVFFGPPAHPTVDASLFLAARVSLCARTRGAPRLHPRARHSRRRVRLRSGRVALDVRQLPGAVV